MADDTFGDRRDALEERKTFVEDMLQQYKDSGVSISDFLKRFEVSDLTSGLPLTPDELEARVVSNIIGSIPEDRSLPYIPDEMGLAFVINFYNTKGGLTPGALQGIDMAISVTATGYEELLDNYQLPMPDIIGLILKGEFPLLSALFYPLPTFVRAFQTTLKSVHPWLSSDTEAGRLAMNLITGCAARELLNPTVNSTVNRQVYERLLLTFGIIARLDLNKLREVDLLPGTPNPYANSVAEGIRIIPGKINPASLFARGVPPAIEI